MRNRSASWKRPTRAVAALVALGLATGAGATTGIGPLTLAVVPNRPALALHKSWSPFVAALQAETGLRIELKLYERLAPFLEAGKAGVPDLLYAAPNMYFEAHRAQGYVPLVRGSQKFSGLVFVRKDAPYRTVKDLHGKVIAFVGPSNLCAVITRHALATTGTTIDYNATFSGSTINVANMVAIGKADAGATLDVSLATDAPELLGQLRTILETPPFAPHPLAAHPRVAPETRERIALAVLRLAGSPAGKRLLAEVRLADPVRADHERDYMTFDAIDLAPPVRSTR
jgi:phosphonate transport system substrate-binding protein